MSPLRTGVSPQHYCLLRRHSCGYSVLGINPPAAKNMTGGISRCFVDSLPGTGRQILRATLLLDHRSNFDTLDPCHKISSSAVLHSRPDCFRIRWLIVGNNNILPQQRRRNLIRLFLSAENDFQVGSLVTLWSQWPVLVMIC